MKISPAVEYVARSVPKHGNRNDENEDATWSSNDVANSRSFRCAVADGASQSVFSGEWAQVLTRAYAVGTLSTFSNQQLRQVRAEWTQDFRGRDLPWYLEDKVLRGGFAAFAGIELSLPIGLTPTGRWQAVAIGDCSLFWVRRDMVIKRFPFHMPEQFGDTPYLVGTNASDEETLLFHCKVAHGHWRAGDAFYLASDALAAWFLQEVKDGRKPWRALDENLVTPELFEALVDSLRKEGRIKNDDATVARIRVF